MKKNLFFLLVATCFAAITTKAQYERPIGSEFSIGLEGALPLNGWSIGEAGFNKKIASFGIGGTLKYAYNFNESIAATLQSGYIYFPGKNLVDGIDGVNGSAKDNISQIPVKAGVRFGFGQFYFEPQFGVSFFHESANINISSESESASAGTSGNFSAFTYAGNIGVMASRNFDISLRYEGWSKNGSAGFLGLRLAYTFAN